MTWKKTLSQSYFSNQILIHIHIDTYNHTKQITILSKCIIHWYYLNILESYFSFKDVFLESEHVIRHYTTVSEICKEFRAGLFGLCVFCIMPNYIKQFSRSLQKHSCIKNVQNSFILIFLLFLSLAVHKDSSTNH